MRCRLGTSPDDSILKTLNTNQPYSLLSQTSKLLSLVFTQSISLSNIRCYPNPGEQNPCGYELQRPGEPGCLCSKIGTSVGKLVAIFKQFRVMVELRRIELLTPCLQSRCSPS